MFADTGILVSTVPDQTWRALRKSAHKHLRQFGDGMSRLEVIITEVGEDMFDDFRSQSGTKLDPHQVQIFLNISIIVISVQLYCY